MTAGSAADGAISVDAAGQPGSVIAQLLAEAGIYPDELRPQTAGLESVFLDLTRGPEGQG